MFTVLISALLNHMLIYVENVNGLQGTMETPGNPSAVEQSTDTDKSEDHCMHVWGA